MIFEALVGAGILLSPGNMPAGWVPDQPTTCQVEVLRQAHQALPYDTSYRWVWARQADYAGMTWFAERTVTLGTDLPCEYVATVVFHEWMHTSGVLDEVAADCGGTSLLNAAGIPGQLDYQPYAQGRCEGVEQ